MLLGEIAGVLIWGCHRCLLWSVVLGIWMPERLPGGLWNLEPVLLDLLRWSIGCGFRVCWLWWVLLLLWVLRHGLRRSSRPEIRIVSVLGSSRREKMIGGLVLGSFKISLMIVSSVFFASSSF